VSKGALNKKTQRQLTACGKELASSPMTRQLTPALKKGRRTWGRGDDRNLVTGRTVTQLLREEPVESCREPLVKRNLKRGGGVNGPTQNSERRENDEAETGRERDTLS